MGERLYIQDVGPRDGLQMHREMISTEGKRQLVEALIKAGLQRIELTSFVHPRAVPQMADAMTLYGQVHEHLSHEDHVEYMGLVVNQKGYDRALQAGARGITAVVACSETLSQRNSRQSLDDAMKYACEVIARAKDDGVKTRVVFGVAWVCPYEGKVPAERIIGLADRVWAAGADEIALADTIGHATPLDVGHLCEVVGQRTDMSKLAVHLHDTLAFGLANASAAISAGVRMIDAAVGGLGGCPFAPGSAGNLATEDLVLLADKMGFETGVSLSALMDAVDLAEELVGRPLGGRTRKWWLTQQEKLQGAQA